MARAAENVFTMVNGVDLLLSAIKIIIMEDTMEAMVVLTRSMGIMTINS